MAGPHVSHHDGRQAHGLARTEVRREGEQLLADEHAECIYRRVPKVVLVIKRSLAILRDAKVAARLRNVHLVAFYRRMVAVVPVVRDLPAEVWRPE